MFKGTPNEWFEHEIGHGSRRSGFTNHGFDIYIKIIELYPMNCSHWMATNYLYPSDAYKEADIVNFECIDVLLLMQNPIFTVNVLFYLRLLHPEA